MKNTRHGLFSLAGGLVVALAVIALPASAHAAPKTSDKVVKATANATKPDADGNQTVTISLTIEAPWHLYANPVQNDDLKEAATSVTFNAQEKPQVVKIEYPAGEVAKDPSLGTYRIYEGTITIKANLRRTKGDTSPLQTEIKVQACRTNKDGTGVCLIGGTVKLTVP